MLAGPKPYTPLSCPMKLFACHDCHNPLYFDNVYCTGCQATLGFEVEELRLATLHPDGNGGWLDAASGRPYRQCANYSGPGVCNWLLPAASSDSFCLSCSLNQMIPDLTVPGNLELWRSLESEKRRLLYAVLAFGLPLVPRSQDTQGLAFEFLADTPVTFSERGRVFTGHTAGVITINIAEADHAERERMRAQMGEPYRTILGHFRHESGHYYWDRLVAEGEWLEPFRALFGDERADYGQALDAYYQVGPAPDWGEQHVSAYASMHPWEDWAETWAHYLHIVDTLDSASHFGLRLRPRVASEALPPARVDFEAYEEENFERLIDHWLPLTYALNSLSRSMGHPHAYPFVLSPMAVRKLAFVHEVVHKAGTMGVSSATE